MRQIWLIKQIDEVYPARLIWFHSITLCNNIARFNCYSEVQEILMCGRRHKKIKFSNSIFIKFYFKAYWRWTCIQGLYPPEPPPGIHHEPVAELAKPQDLHLYFTIILWSFSMKCNIRKLNLCSKTDISKTVWINACYLIIKDLQMKYKTNRLDELKLIKKIVMRSLILI